MPQIEEPSNQSHPSSKYALLDLAFRPFFLGAASVAVASMVIWMLVYSFGWHLSITAITPVAWHAHEMIFGYTVAVIAGFLLTAIQNWTGVATIRFTPLLILFSFWVAVRILPFIPFISLNVVAVIDTLFFLLLIVAALRPVLQVKQVKQYGIVVVLLLLFVSNSVFYLGVIGIIKNGIQIGLYSGLYLILFLIFIMARRVIPFFIEKGVDQSITVRIINFKWLDSAVLILFALYALLDIFTLHFNILMIVTGLLLLLHSVRMIGWYSKGLWAKPLLWSIYLAYGFIVLGFALKLLINYYGFLPYLEIHSFTVGGIGLLTIGMMSRVALGHTGRNVFEPPKIIFWIVLIFTIAVFCRVVLPVFIPQLYSLSILLSQIFWIIAFVLFLIVYFPILVHTRIDGREG